MYTPGIFINMLRSRTPADIVIIAVLKDVRNMRNMYGWEAKVERKQLGSIFGMEMSDKSKLGSMFFLNF